MKKIIIAIIALLFIAVTVSCAKRADISVKVNGVLMPREIQNSILSSDENKKIKVVWYYYRTHNKTIRSQGISEVIQEEQPLDFQMPKELPSDTSQVGIRIIVYNPYFLRFRISVLDGSSKEEKKIYDGIKENHEVILTGPIAKDRQCRISARVDLIGKNGSFVADSADIGDLVYSINSSKSD